MKISAWNRSLTERRIEALGQVLNEHGVPTLDERTGYTLNFVGRTENLIRSLEAHVTELEDALRACEATDRSKPYEYGEADRNGREPKAGQRWNTPREIARDVLNQSQKGDSE